MPVVFLQASEWMAAGPCLATGYPALHPKRGVDLWGDEFLLPNTEASQAVLTTNSGQVIPLWLWWPGEDLKQWEP